VWLEVEADSSRENPKDIIKINILDKNKKDICQVIIEVDEFTEDTLDKIDKDDDGEIQDFFPDDDEG